jgi:NAD+ synthase (glutamine-hydrolysing)
VRIALGQFDATVGDLAGNVETMRQMWARAVGAGADLVVFPELAICGYPPEDLVYKKQFVKDNRAALEELAVVCPQKMLVVGFVESRDGNLHNSAAVIQEGGIVHVYRKGLLPNTSVFDEQRYFRPGVQPVLFDAAGLRIAVTICQDLWDPAWLAGFFAGTGPIDLMVNISASPFHVRKVYQRHQVVGDCCRLLHCAVAYCNLVGGQDELVFDGRSILADATGKIIAVARAFEEDLLLADLAHPPRRGVPDHGQAGPAPRGWEARESDTAIPAVSTSGFSPVEGLPTPKRHGAGLQEKSRGQDARATVEVQPLQPPVPQPRDEVEEVYQALVLGTRDYARKNAFKQVLLGLSGGIDSAVTAAVGAAALGPENVLCVTMPSRFNSPETIADAKLVADNLGCPLLTIPIEPILKPFHESLGAEPRWNDQGLAYENLQARIRGMILMSLSNQIGALVLTTGNKSEVSVGYSTLYGDTAGGFSVIKDVLKTMVYRLARHMNERAGRELIPASTIDRVPTAELRPNQRDQDSLPEYSLLDRIITGYVEQDQSARDLVAAGLPAEEVERVIRMIDRNEYKRRQSPPGVRITAKAFGKDRRLPITNHYRTTVRDSKSHTRSSKSAPNSKSQ